MSLIERHQRVQDKLQSDLGPEIMAALADPDIVEIMLNEDGALWVDTYEGLRHYRDYSADRGRNLINTVASISGEDINAESPNIAAEIKLFANGEVKKYRFQGLIPPIVSNPVFCIRKPASRVIPLSEYVRQGVLTEEQSQCLRAAIAAKCSILVIGGTGSGKTTFCNALLNEMSAIAPQERVILIEDTLELQCAVPNKIYLRTSDTRSMDDLLRYCMRLRPDRIIVGEVRGKEAHTLIKAWNTGHPGGMATIHANRAAKGLLRLEQLIQEANVQPIPEAIVEAVNLLVAIEKSPNTQAGRQIKEILTVQGWTSGGGYILN
ncbi:MAG: P-type conjugative transfer ATPase TrbB [Candidatus Omnitrophica bacterium]|nr:P-type conjugative transfer ATPase TrbB [Candidatus Omnitrophota bacterium]